MRYLDFDVNGRITSLPVENSSVQDTIAQILYYNYFKQIGEYKKVKPMLAKMINDFGFYDDAVINELVNIYADDIKEILREEVLKTIYD